MVGEDVKVDENIYAYISLITNFLRKLQSSNKFFFAPGKNLFVWSDTCVDKWYVWAPRLCSLALWRLWSWPIWWEGDCAPSLAGISKHTDSPSLKLSLEATDEMAQIMRHIINHRQGAAGSCYTHIYVCTYTFCLSICGTHREPAAKRAEQRKDTAASEQRQRSLPKQYFDSAHGYSADWSIVTKPDLPRIRLKEKKVSVTPINTSIPQSDLRNTVRTNCHKEKCFIKRHKGLIRKYSFWN